MKARLRNTALAGATLGAAALLLAGCLFSIDAKPEDGGVIGGGNVFLVSAPFEEEGVDPPDSDEDTDSYDFGPYCSALVECVCSELDPDEYLQCVEDVAELDEDECEAILEANYEECLPDAGLWD
jgi:hypothetical protein